MADTELDELRARMLAELAKINVAISRLQSDADTIKSDLRRLPLGDYTVNGRPAVRIAPTRRFDPLLGLALLPEELQSKCYQTELNPRMVKRFLAPALLDSAMIEVGEPSVRLL